MVPLLVSIVAVVLAMTVHPPGSLTLRRAHHRPRALDAGPLEGWDRAQPLVLVPRCGEVAGELQAAGPLEPAAQVGEGPCGPVERGLVAGDPAGAVELRHHPRQLLDPGRRDR